ncbi:MAG: hypothetical protein IJ634_03150 [Bacteroidales bacterium]|nr:hypothetical protein [Bacteroidales bacterium]
MKRLAIIAVFALAGTFVFPQRAQAQLSINAGYILQEHSFNLGNGTLATQVSQEDNWMHGGFAGVSLNVPMIGNLSLAPGAYLNFAQMKRTLDDGSEPTTSDFAFKVPFHFNFSFGKVFVFAGPVFNMSLSTIRNLATVNNSSDLHFDMGFNAGVGAQFGIFHIYTGFNIGLIDHQNFNYASTEAYTAAWEGSTFMAGIGFDLGSRY